MTTGISEPEKKSNNAFLVHAIPKYPVEKKQNRLKTSIINIRKNIDNITQGMNISTDKALGVLRYEPKKIKPISTITVLNIPCTKTAPVISEIDCTRKEVGLIQRATTVPCFISLASVFSLDQLRRFESANATKI
jgi:hypothetical protein